MLRRLSQLLVVLLFLTVSCESIKEEHPNLDQLNTLLSAGITSDNITHQTAIAASVTNGNYITPLVNLLQSGTELIQQFPPDIYYQSLATNLSYLGVTNIAHEAWARQTDTIECELAVSELNKLDKLVFLDAKTYIIDQAKERQLTLINEAHHVPLHRRFTASLLEEFYEAGYRYFAVETISHGRVNDLNDRKYPLQNNGVYLPEPQYGDLIRKALAIGYEIIAYEASYGENYSERDSIQAVNILSVLEKDTQAKILVHGGYAHIYEGSNDDWIKMGEYIQKLSGIDPLTIDQTKLTERHPSDENCYYRAILEDHDLSKPSIALTAEKGTTWVTPKIAPFVDLQVMHPRAVWSNNRPINPVIDEQQLVVFPIDTKFKEQTVLVQCFIAEEVATEGSYDNLIPVDQYLKFPNKNRVTLRLKPDSYIIRVADLSNQELMVVRREVE